MANQESAKALQELAEKAASSYVRFAVYIDDHIYTKENGEDRRFWSKPQELVELFAGAGIALTLFEFYDISQKQSIIDIVERADISILDWEMYCTIQSEGNAAGVGDSATVTKENFGKLILKELCAKEDKRFIGPRLICIYTKDPDLACAALGGELDLANIAPGVYIGKKKHTLRFCVVDKDPKAVQRILSTTKLIDEETDVTRESAMEGVDDTASSPVSSDAEELQVGQKGVLTISDRNFVLVLMQQFALIHFGILPTLTLNILASIRENTPVIMNKFPNRLDNALIVDAALSAYPESAIQLAYESVFDYIASIFKYCYIDNKFSQCLMEAWIDSKDFSEASQRFADNADIWFDATIINKDDRKEWLKIGYTAFLKNKFSIDETKIEEEARKVDDFVGIIELLFSADGQGGNIQSVCRNYATICHQKVSSNDNVNPKTILLSLGTIVLLENRPFMCIQQGCDSLRIIEPNGRSFLFVPLISPDGKKIDVINGRQYYRVDSHPYNLRKWRFCPLKGQTAICGIPQGKKIVFNGKDEMDKAISLEWVFNLKDCIALKIVDDFAHQLARVAINASEWFRLKCKKITPLEQEMPIPYMTN